MRTARGTAGLLAAVMLALSLGIGATPAAAKTSKEDLWRIATYIGGAGTIYALAKGKDTWALIGGAATLLSYSQWRREMKKRHRRADLAAYRAYRLRWLKKHRGHRIVRVRR